MKKHILTFSLYDPGIPVAVWRASVGREEWYFEAPEHARVEVLTAEWLEVVQ